MESEGVTKKSDEARDRKLATEAIFWIHVILIVILFIMAITRPLCLLLLTIPIQRFLMYLFKGCIITKIERCVRNDPKYDFLQEVTFRAFGVEINRKQSKYLDYGIITAVIIVALVFLYIKMKKNGKEYSIQGLKEKLITSKVSFENNL